MVPLSSGGHSAPFVNVCGIWHFISVQTMSRVCPFARQHTHTACWTILHDVNTTRQLFKKQRVKLFIVCNLKRVFSSTGVNWEFQHDNWGRRCKRYGLIQRWERPSSDFRVCRERMYLSQIADKCRSEACAIAQKEFPHSIFLTYRYYFECVYGFGQVFSHCVFFPVLTVHMWLFEHSVTWNQ